MRFLPPKWNFCKNRLRFCSSKRNFFKNRLRFCSSKQNFFKNRLRFCSSKWNFFKNRLRFCSSKRNFFKNRKRFSPSKRKGAPTVLRMTKKSPRGETCSTVEVVFYTSVCCSTNSLYFSGSTRKAMSGKDESACASAFSASSCSTEASIIR